MALFHIGLIINPLAGVGGPAGFKGSDGVAEQAIALGIVPKAAQRTRVALEGLLALRDRLQFVTYPGAMGADLLDEMGFAYRLPEGVEREQQSDAQTTADDTRKAVELLQNSNVALILFAGGDGTARDVCAAAREGQPVLGIPAGVKIQSGVYAISPRAAGGLTRRLVEGGLVRLASGEVRDIDETALREGKVAARWYGELTVPEEGGFVQQVKQGGVESEELVLSDLAAWLEDTWEQDVRYVFGPGSTMHGLATNLGLNTTLLGVDVIENGQVIATDVNEMQLHDLVAEHPARLLVTAIGGQGYILGRGNQQVSARVVRAIGLDNLRVVATKRKLATLEGRALLVDTGDVELDLAFPNAVRIWAGYREELLYPVAHG